MKGARLHLCIVTESSDAKRWHPEVIKRGCSRLDEKHGVKNGQPNRGFINGQILMKEAKLYLCITAESSGAKVRLSEVYKIVAGLIRYTISKKHLNKHGIPCKLDRLIISHHLQEGRRKRFQQLPWDFDSLPILEWVSMLSTVQTVDWSGGFPTRGRMCLSSK